MSGRPITWDHRNVRHAKIAMPEARQRAIKRAAMAQGLSEHAMVQKFITAGLVILGECE
jgi:hypothetical protein